uniref:Solute carrier organic anion transporter family member 4A1-like n=1 Tax=Hirondellea gigas TaxID=1518452 RepID=A0A2P2I6E8_9CRUS
MSNDAYEASGLYSHQNTAPPQRQQQRLKQQQKNKVANSDTSSKRWKKGCTSVPEPSTTSDLSSQHRKAVFSRDNSNSSSNSGATITPSAASSSNNSNDNNGVHPTNGATRSGSSCEKVGCAPVSHTISASNRSINSITNHNTTGANTNVDRGTDELNTNRNNSIGESNALNQSCTFIGDRLHEGSSNILYDNRGITSTNADEKQLQSSLSQSTNVILPSNNGDDSTNEDTVYQCSEYINLEIQEISPGGVHQSSSVASANTNMAASPATTTSTMLPDASTAECGILTCRPTLLQKFATIKMFVLLLSLLVTVQQAVASGYLNSVITTLEKRYEVPSYITGLISSMYEIGNVSTVLFVSYLGSSRHIPVWIAIGCVAMGTGSLLFVGPQILLESWSIEIPGANSSNSSSICTAATVRRQPIDQLPELGFPKLPRLGSSSKSGCPEGEAAPFQMTPVLLFMAGQLLLGAGGSPLLTLGTTYIDDHVRREDSSLYIGIIYTMGAFGPVLGFLLGGYLLSFYVDTFFIPDSQITIERTHPRWIGMWWAGFLIGSVALFILSIPFIMFPKKLVKEREKVRLAEKKSIENVKGHKRSKSETSTCSRLSKTSLASRRMYGRDVRDIPACLFKLILNPIYFMTCLAACMELIIVSGFIVFLPKYLETQFSLSNVQASVFTGGVAIPGACVGTLLGGVILKRFSLRPKGAVQMLMICNLIGLSLYGLFFVLGCENVKMAGTTSPYFNRSGGRFSSAKLQSKPTSASPSSSSMLSALSSSTLPKFITNTDSMYEWSPTTTSGLGAGGSVSSYTGDAPSSWNSAGQLTSSFTVNLTSWCNTGCECSHRLAEPVCGNNGLTYFSPCHAGCTAASPSSFSNCTCIDSVATDPSSNQFAEVVVVPVATSGPCYIPCNTFVPFMAVLFLMCASVATSQMPLLMILLRSVSEEERALALGLQFVMYRLIAYIPAPIMFGSVIDSTCLMWTSSCGAGRCLMYDIEQFRFRYVGICASIKVIAAAIFVFDWLLIRWQYRLDMAGTLTVGDIVNSLRSVDRREEDTDEFSSNGNARSSFTTSGSHHNHHNHNHSYHHYSPTITTTTSTSAGQKTGTVYTAPSSPPPPYKGAASHNTQYKPGHKRSQSGCPSGSGPWVGGGAAGVHHHRRSHSTSSPPPGILSNLPGHTRRPSAGYQVSFRDAENVNASTPNEDLAQLESLLKEGDGDPAPAQDPSSALGSDSTNEEIVV